MSKREEWIWVALLSFCLFWIMAVQHLYSNSDGYRKGFIEGHYTIKPVIFEKTKKVIIYNCDEPGPLPYIPPSYEDIPDYIDLDSVRHHI